MVVISIDVPQRSWYATVAKYLHETVNVLLVVVMRIPKHSRIRYIRLGTSFVGSIQGWKFDRVSGKENWKVVEYGVLVSLLCEQLQSPTSYISHGFRCTFLPSQSRQTGKCFYLFPDATEEGRGGNVRYVVSYFKFTPCSCYLRMNDSLEYPLTLKMGQLHKKLSILE